MSKCLTCNNNDFDGKCLKYNDRIDRAELECEIANWRFYNGTLTDCIMYREEGKSKKCTALTVLNCKKGKCSFYKSSWTYNQDGTKKGSKAFY